MSPEKALTIFNTLTGVAGLIATSLTFAISMATSSARRAQGPA